mgnify:CR=1 FL=1|tara:strand:+ start:11603 stop:11824 length:222 start_codon:yes stop_codon:yes gene_type:complete
MISIEKYNDFVIEETDEFYDDLENDGKKLRLFSTFVKSDLDQVKTNFTIPEPKKRFQPKIKAYKKTNNNKGIF